MSTFDGKVPEFPDIRIDRFRAAREESRPPLAFFLSHVHSDHLVGLETCKSPFIYCSPATREILLRLEKYPHRMNFAKGILETRRQTYRHLKNLLKPIPYETPTTLELAPGRSLRVTLFDANHCIGAAMFLIEDESRAILYTGDIRSEQWWVNSLTRHPFMIPYACREDRGSMKKLDCIYLDTTFASKAEHHRDFCSKGDGIAELLSSVSQYPSDTVFYFDSWTFGYEEVWLALSAFLKSRIHVDDYRYGLYASLAYGNGPKPDDVPRLVGFNCGNHFQEGCLTRGQARLHSCEAGTGCEVSRNDFVRITPIISRKDGMEMAELGAGGGQGDLDQRHELELGDDATTRQLIALCRQKLSDQNQILEATVRLLESLSSNLVAAIPLDASALHTEATQEQAALADFDELPLEALVPAVVNFVRRKRERSQQEDVVNVKASGRKSSRRDGQPQRITFPYSRHSSYAELCYLIEAFRPEEIHPCTVDEASWTFSVSMEQCFGHLYPEAKKFRHDEQMLRRPRKTHPLRRLRRLSKHDTSRGQYNDLGKPRQPSPQGLAAAARRPERPRDPLDALGTSSVHLQPEQRPNARQIDTPEGAGLENDPAIHRPSKQARMSGRAVSAPELENSPLSLPQPSDNAAVADDQQTPGMLSLSPAVVRAAMQREAYKAALARDGTAWSDIGLVSVSGHTCMEEEL